MFRLLSIHHTFFDIKNTIYLISHHNKNEKENIKGKKKISTFSRHLKVKWRGHRTQRGNASVDGGKNKSLTEKALRKTRHCIMPSIVSPVKQKVPLRCRPLRPITEQRLACTKAFCDRVAAVRAGWWERELIRRSSESMSSNCRWFLVLISLGGIMAEKESRKYHGVRAPNFETRIEHQSWSCLFFAAWINESSFPVLNLPTRKLPL